MAEDLFRREMFRVVEELTPKNVKDLELLFSLGNRPWTKSTDGNAGFIFEQMKHAMIWVFDSEYKKCSVRRLAEDMGTIHRDDLKQKLYRLGKTGFCCYSCFWRTLEGSNWGCFWCERSLEINFEKIIRYDTIVA